MAIIIFSVFNWFAFAIGLPWRFVMKPLLKWWQKMGTDNLKRSVRIENIKIKAVKPNDNLPFLNLLFSINNGSETNIIIKRVYGSIYIGDWRIANYDVHEPIKKTLGNNRQQHLVIQNQNLKKGDKSEVEFNFYPSVEFWLSKKNTCSLGDGAIEVLGYGVNITIPYFQDNLPINGLEEIAQSYHALLKKDGLIAGSVNND
jgi:hypothetical protein